MIASMKNQAESAFHQLMGKMKEIVGEISDNPELQAEGTQEKIAGKVQGKIGSSKELFEK